MASCAENMAFVLSIALQHCLLLLHSRSHGRPSQSMRWTPYAPIWSVVTEADVFLNWDMAGFIG